MDLQENLRDVPPSGVLYNTTWLLYVSSICRDFPFLQAPTFFLETRPFLTAPFSTILIMLYGLEFFGRTKIWCTWRRIPQTFLGLHTVTDSDVVDNPRTALWRFDIPGAVIIESCTTLCATTCGCGSSGIPPSKALRWVNDFLYIYKANHSELSSVSVLSTLSWKAE